MFDQIKRTEIDSGVTVSRAGGFRPAWLREAMPGQRLVSDQHHGGNPILPACRRRFKTGFLAGSKPDSLLETESA